MVRNKIIFLFLAISTLTFGQGRNAIWCFGDSAGIDFNIPSNPITFQSGMSPRGSCVTISDSSGHLLFYAGVNDNAGYLAGKLKAGMVYNRDHNLMINGDSLIGEAWYHEMVIIPDPANNNSFYLFHIGVNYDFGLFYSVIDMTQDSGRGAVISKNNVLDTFPAIDCLQAVKHGNGRDWWLIFRRSQPYTNEFFEYLISPAGIQLQAVDTAGFAPTSNAGDFVFNSDGSRFALCNLKGMLSIFNFDRCIGKITLYKTIQREDMFGNFPYYVACALSSNDSVLYVSSVSYYSSQNANDIYLYQYNLAAPNILNSKKTIQQFHYPVVPGGLRLAPDHKIYLSSDIDIYPYDSTNYQPEIMNLSVINDPNNIDTACHFQPFSFYLGGKRTYFGLPNNPNYDLGPVAGSVCDSLFNSVEQISNDQSGITIYPNPTTGIITLNRIFLGYSKCTFDVFDLDGKHCYSSVLDVTMNPIQKDLSMLKNGVYFLRIQCDGISMETMKLIIIK